MLAELRPEMILIEGPSDLNHHIPYIADADTVPPVAIATSVETDGNTTVRYYPLSAHTPEYVAIIDGLAAGADIRFIDLPSGHRDGMDVQSLQSELPFSSADFIVASCKKLGLRDGAELWDHLFETRLGETDWRGFFGDVYAYCLALRETTDPVLMEADQTFIREAEMRRHLADAKGKRTLVLTGGFHTPALVGTEKPGKAPNGAQAESYLVPFGEAALDKLSGYAAGLRYPAWYNAGWEAAQAAGGVPDWMGLLLDTITGFARDPELKQPIALPQLTEMAEIAQGLARMKGRNAALLPDIFDGMRTALIKTETGPGEPYTQQMHRFLSGARLGQVPRSAATPPLLADARRLAEKYRIDLSDSIPKLRKLDIRRKARHRAAQQFFYQMELLETGLAGLEIGPDFVLGYRVDLLFSEWTVAWSPYVEGALLTAAPFGATVEIAAVTALMQRRDKLVADASVFDLDGRLTLVLTGLRAGLGKNLTSLLSDLTEAIARTGDFTGLAKIISRLQSVALPSDPLFDRDAPDMLIFAQSAYQRIVYLMDDLTTVPVENFPKIIEALGIVAGVLNGPQAARFDAARFALAASRVLAQSDCPAILSGALLGLMVRSDLRPDTELAAVLRGGISGVGLTSSERGAALNGLLMTAPNLLWQNTAILGAAQTALSALGDDEFLTLLPPLRLALTQLNPHETDRLAQEVSALLGASQSNLQIGANRFSEADLALGISIDEAIGRQLAVDFSEHA